MRTSLPPVTWRQIKQPERKPYADRVVEALFQAAWSDESHEPLNTYDDAERIVEIVRAAIEAQQ